MGLPSASKPSPVEGPAFHFALVQESTLSSIPPSSAQADTDAKRAGPRGSRRLLLAVVAAFVVAYTSENALPLLIGSLIDGFGLDKLDRSYLEILLECGFTSLGVISSKLSLPTQTLQRIVEPYLLKEGFIIKNKSSARVITEKGRCHVKSNCLFLNDGGYSENVVR